MSDLGDVNTTGLLMGQVLIWTGSEWEPADNRVAGVGVNNYIPRWSGTGALENSVIYQTDGGRLGVGITAPIARFDIRNTDSDRYLCWTNRCLWH